MRNLYALWVDMDELAAEDGRVARQQVADEGIEVLKEINRGRNSMGRALKGSGARPPG